jgi:hypothetical protein
VTKICLAAAQQQIHFVQKQHFTQQSTKKYKPKQTKIIGKLLMHLTLINKNNRSDIVVHELSVVGSKALWFIVVC